MLLQAGVVVGAALLTALLALAVSARARTAFVVAVAYVSLHLWYAYRLVTKGSSEERRARLHPKPYIDPKRAASLKEHRARRDEQKRKEAHRGSGGESGGQSGEGKED